MKQLILVVFLVMSVFVKAQQNDTTDVMYDIFPAQYKNLPTSVANSFEIPINKKFTIKLHTTNSIHFDYSVVNFERYQEAVYCDDLAYYFSKDDAENGTIEMYFCVGLIGEKSSSGRQNGGVVLVMKNRAGIDLTYDVEIKKSFFSKKIEPVTTLEIKATAIKYDRGQ